VEKLDLKPNRLQGGEERCNTIDGGQSQHRISKWMTRANGRVNKKKKKNPRRGKERRGE
jgi:hypothetical protein